MKSEALQKEVDSLKAEIEDLKRSRKASNHVVFTSSGSDSDVLTTPVTKRKKVDTEEEEETDLEDSHYSVYKPGKYDHLKVVASRLMQPYSNNECYFLHDYKHKRLKVF